MMSSNSIAEDGWYLSISDVSYHIVKSSMLVVRLSQHNEQLFKQNQNMFVNFVELLIAVLLDYISLIFVLFFSNRSQATPTFWS